jgi:hypothetical protein
MEEENVRNGELCTILNAGVDIQHLVAVSADHQLQTVVL